MNVTLSVAWDALATLTSPGRPRLLTPSHAKELQEVVTSGPGLNKATALCAFALDFVHKWQCLALRQLRVALAAVVCVPPTNQKAHLKMNDTDKMVAATFAVARCSGLGNSEPEAYIAEYDTFLRLLAEREATTEPAEKDAAIPPWKFAS